MDSCAELVELNQATFDAEAKKQIGDFDWKTFLLRTLSSGFVIRRSNPAVPNQDRDDMIEFIERQEPRERELLSKEIATWCSDELGVIACPVVTTGGDGQLHRFQNVKVFEKDSNGSWQCVYWQVTDAGLSM